MTIDQIITAVGRWWRKRQRTIDMDMLWPSFVSQAKTMDDAKAGFAFHVFNDPAWTTDFSKAELIEYISALRAWKEKQ